MVQNSQLIMVFGYPGVGKTYVGNVLKKHFGFYFFDGDVVLSRGMKQAIKTKTPFTDSMRSLFFQRLRKSVDSFIKQKPRIAVAQTFIKERYRKDFLQRFPQAQFILVTADNSTREKRLKERSDLDIAYARLMTKNFELPQLEHFELTNNAEGEKKIVKQLQKLGIIE